MPIPTGYTEDELAAYMHAEIQNFAGILGYTNPTSYVEEITDILLAYGVDDISAATDIRKLRATARAVVWQKVMKGTANFYDFQDEDQRVERKQMHDHARAMFLQYKDEAAAIGVDVSPVAVEFTSVGYNDPYYPRTDDDI